MCACSLCFLLLAIALWNVVSGIVQVCIGSKEHNSQGAECKQQAANAPLQNPCLCTFKFLSLGYTCIKGLLGSMLEA